MQNAQSCLYKDQPFWKKSVCQQIVSTGVKVELEKWSTKRSRGRCCHAADTKVSSSQFVAKYKSHCAMSPSEEPMAIGSGAKMAKKVKRPQSPREFFRNDRRLEEVRRLYVDLYNLLDRLYKAQTKAEKKHTLD
ncbi:unnamed protein product [Bursaphelenchus xylophilus]|uniref:(pine wood nematode) hypothetical protein n=1 Tax=Bursaphelenchus xylophilus TaxID=6326 RepID=A0A1I7S6Y2_BURXY|nr:unnamed protein product [Bursaphelenchus xylophilus]CAG9079604.1 unnamed protein product [Bursaphelenchus xylophilus]